MYPLFQITDIQLLESPLEVPNAGRVQVRYNSEWRDVCHDGGYYDKDWTIDEAMVACRQLGYPGTAMRRKGGYGNGTSKGLDDYRCYGSKFLIVLSTSLYYFICVNNSQDKHNYPTCSHKKPDYVELGICISQ